MSFRGVLYSTVMLIIIVMPHHTPWLPFEKLRNDLLGTLRHHFEVPGREGVADTADVVFGQVHGVH